MQPNSISTSSQQSAQQQAHQEGGKEIVTERIEAIALAFPDITLHELKTLRQRWESSHAD